MIEKLRSIKKIGRTPVNSRIYVSYNEEGKPPKITFKYPKRNAEEQVENSSPTILPAMILAGIIILSIFLLIQSPKINENIPQIINGTFGNDTIILNYTYNGENKLDVISYMRHGNFIRKTVSWKTVYSPPSDTLLGEFSDILILVFAFYILFSIFSKFLSLVFRKTNWGHNKFPEFNKMMHDEKFSAIFKEAPNGTVELPLFKNMYLDYRAVGEFSKHLKTFEIVEHPFNKITKQRKQGLKFWKRDKKKDKNIFLWKAVFTFDQPIQKTKGSFLEIRWT